MYSPARTVYAVAVPGWIVKSFSVSANGAGSGGAASSAGFARSIVRRKPVGGFCESIALAAPGAATMTSSASEAMSSRVKPAGVSPFQIVAADCNALASTPRLSRPVSTCEAALLCNRLAMNEAPADACSSSAASAASPCASKAMSSQGCRPSISMICKVSPGVSATTVRPPPATRYRSHPAARANSAGSAGRELMGVRISMFFPGSRRLAGGFQRRNGFAKIRVHRVIECRQPRRVMRRGLRAGHQRAIGLVAVAHDVVMLVVFPFEEGLVHPFDVETRVVGRIEQLLDVATLKLEHFLIGDELFFFRAPCEAVCGHFRFRRQRDASEDHIARIPGLSVEHVERIPEVLHAEVDQAWIVFPENAFIEVQRPQTITGLQA